jgi:hypothetical protein
MPRRPGRRLVLGAVVVLIAGGVGAIALTGGLADARTVATPLAKAGAVVHGDFVDVTVHGAEITDTRPGAYGTAPDGKVFLVVHATITDRDPQPWVSQIGEVRATLDGYLTQSDRAEDQDARTGAGYLLFNPGVPTDVDYYWTLPERAVKDGQGFWVGVYQRRHVQSDPVFGSSSLTGAQAMAVVDLRMEDAR